MGEHIHTGCTHIHSLNGEKLFKKLCFHVFFVFFFVLLFLNKTNIVDVVVDNSRKRKTNLYSSIYFTTERERVSEKERNLPNKDEGR